MIRKFDTHQSDPLCRQHTIGISFTRLLQIDFYLDDQDIIDDLRIINKVSGKPLTKKITTSPPSPVENCSELKIEDGRLFYDKRWLVHLSMDRNIHRI